MATVMFVSAWGAHEARTICEMSESQAEPLLATGVVILVDVAPNVFEALAEPPAVQAAKPRRKRR